MLEFRLFNRNAAKDIKNVTTFFNRAKKVVDAVRADINIVGQTARSMLTLDTPDFEVTIPSIEFSPELAPKSSPISWESRYADLPIEIKDHAAAIFNRFEPDQLKNPVYQPLVLQALKAETPQLLDHPGDYPLLYRKLMGHCPPPNAREVFGAKYDRFQDWRQSRLTSSNKFNPFSNRA